MQNMLHLGQIGQIGLSAPLTRPEDIKNVGGANNTKLPGSKVSTITDVWQQEGDETRVGFVSHQIIL